MTLDEVSGKLGITRERVRQIETRATGSIGLPVQGQVSPDYLAN